MNGKPQWRLRQTDAERGHTQKLRARSAEIELTTIVALASVTGLQPTDPHAHSYFMPPTKPGNHAGARERLRNIGNRSYESRAVQFWQRELRELRLVAYEGLAKINFGYECCRKPRADLRQQPVAHGVLPLW